MVRNAFNNKVKNFLYKKMMEKPAQEMENLVSQVKDHVDNNNLSTVKEYIAVIKYMIKDKLSSKPKFYSLLLLKEIMEIDHPEIIEYFTKKIINRLFYIAQFESKNASIDRGERCLKKYYNLESKENREYSKKFFILLLECWKHWNKKLGPKNKKIKQKSDKLKALFPQTDLYYNYLDNLSGLHRKSFRYEDSFKEDQVSKKENSYLNVNNSYVSHNHSLNESLYNKNDVSDKLGILKNTTEVLYSMIKEESEETAGETIKTLYDNLSGHMQFFQKIKEKTRENRALDDHFKNEVLTKIQEVEDIISYFDLYYRGESNFKELQYNIEKLQRKVMVNQRNQIDQVTTIHSINNSDIHMSVKKRSINEFSNKKSRSSNKEIGHISRNSDKKDRSLSKGQNSQTLNLSISKERSGFEGSTDKHFDNFDDEIIREQEELDDEDNFDTFGDFGNKTNDDQENAFTFKVGNKRKSDNEWDKEGDNFGTEIGDFSDFKEDNKSRNLGFNDQMHTIDEDPREDFESTVNQSKFKDNSKIMNSKEQSFKVNKNNSNSHIDGKSDNFTDFNFNNWENNDSGINAFSKTNESQKFTKSERKSNKQPRSSQKRQEEKEMMRKSEKFHKKESKFKKKRNKHIPSDNRSIDKQSSEKIREEKFKRRFSKSKEPEIDEFKEGDNDFVREKIFKTQDEEENMNFDFEDNDFGVSGTFRNSKSRITRNTFEFDEGIKKDDEEFESFEQNALSPPKLKDDPFSQFQMQNEPEKQDVFEKPTFKGKMTFGHSDFENVEKTEEDKPKSESDNEDFEFDLNKSGFAIQEEKIVNKEEEIKNDEFAEPNFDSTLDNKLMGLKNQFDDGGISTYSDNRKSIIVQQIEDNLQSPRQTKVVKLPLITERTEKTLVTERSSKKRESTEFRNVRESIGEKLPTKAQESRKTFNNVEREMVELKTQKEHYKQQ